MTCQFNVAVRLYQGLKLELLHTVQYPKYCTGSQSMLNWPIAKDMQHIQEKCKKVGITWFKRIEKSVRREDKKQIA